MPPNAQYRAHAIASHVSQLARDLRIVADGVAAASAAYETREAFLRAAAHEASSALFWGLGRLVALVLPAVAPAVLGGALALMAAAAVTGKGPEEIMNSLMARAGKALPSAESAPAEGSKASMTSLLSDPQLVTGISYVVSGIDDLVAGLLGLPLPLVAGLGEHGAGLLGPSAVAGAIVVGAGIGAGLGAGGSEKALAETPVTVTRVSTEPTSGPGGIEDLVGRIPHADPDMPQVRIERYEPDAGGQPTFVVYLGGTIDSSLLATDEPWDMTSNLVALADLDAGSLRAALAAMRAAGIASDDLVTLVGHSQGGLLAARLAQSPDFRIGDVVTVGAPIHQIAVPHGVTVTALEHTEDLVPTLGGVSLEGVGAVGGLLGAVVGAGAFAGAGTAGGGSTSGSTTFVRRSALGGMVPDGSDPLPGHNLNRYVETGRVIDSSADAQLVALRSRLAENTRGVAETTFWRGERTAR